MFRAALLAGLCLSSPAVSETLIVPELAPDGSLLDGFPDCSAMPYDQANCVRILACLGDDGVWFDGQARGWDQGTLTGLTSDGAACAGTWDSGQPSEPGRSNFECSDGTVGSVTYTTRDGETGTVIGSGSDNKGRSLRVWTGLFVLDFLRGENQRPELPCGAEAIPIS